MSAIPPKADIAERDPRVRFVQKADIRQRKLTCPIDVGPGFAIWPLRDCCHNPPFPS
jgi:hypothetical protein